MTSDLMARIWEHRAGTKSRFPSKYAVHRLVYVETLTDMDTAIAREKQLKRWHRQWKINLIEADNPQWTDLAVGLGFEPLKKGPAPFASRHPELGSGPNADAALGQSKIVVAGLEPGP